MAVSGKGYVLNGLLQLNRYKRNSPLVKDSVGEAGSVVVSDLLFGASSGQTLTPGLYSNTSTFYSPTVSVGAVNLTVGLFTNTPSLHTPTVTVGTITLLPGLYTNTPTFYSATVSQGTTPQTLLPGLYTNNNVLYAPVVSVGTINLTPGLFTNNQSFYSAVISTGVVALTPSLFTNTSTFYAANVFDPDAVSTIRYDISTGRLVKIINNYVCISL